MTYKLCRVLARKSELSGRKFIMDDNQRRLREKCVKLHRDNEIFQVCYPL